MAQKSDLDYFAARAEYERKKSESALDRDIAAIHIQLAETYERLAEGLVERPPGGTAPPANRPPSRDQETNMQ